MSDSWVLGLETDFQGSEINNRFSRISPYFGPTFFEARQGIDYFGTVRGRIGYATGNMLIYGSGGLAYDNVITKIRLANLGFTNSLHNDETEAGYAVGGVGTQRHVRRARLGFCAMSQEVVRSHSARRTAVAVVNRHMEASDATARVAGIRWATQGKERGQ